MNRFKFALLIVVSIVIAIWLATALNSFAPLAVSPIEAYSLPNAGTGGGEGARANLPTVALKNYLPIIIMNSPAASGGWLLAGNAGTNWASDFLGTTDNMTLTFRVSNTIAYRIVPAVHPIWGIAPDIIGGSPVNSITAGLYGATIAGGGANAYPIVINGSGDYATIGGGGANTASGHGATIAGGTLNLASGQFPTIGGGAYNTTSSDYATVPGGYENVAAGSNSFAAGCSAKANHTGAFVWADTPCFNDFSSTLNNQFLVRASGGITLYTTSSATSGSSIAAGASLYPGSGSWNNLSNKNLKANFADVDSRAILERVSELPISTWNYTTQDESIRHIGPMAQDFAAAFKVGENDTTISTVDAQGVALAAIQGLNQVVAEKETRLAALEKDNAELKAQNAKLDARLAALEQNAPSNALTLNALAPWGIVGLLAVVLMRKGQRTLRRTDGSSE